MKSSRQVSATVIPYGPDNTRATKLVVAIFKEPDVHHPVEMRKWQVTEGDVRNDPHIAAEVAAFLQKHQVSQSATSDRLLGCPHEAGTDYPMGRNCPHCPYWANRDRSTHELITSPPATLGVEQILQELSRYEGLQPLAALESADALRDALVDPLLEAMARCLDRPAEASGAEGMLFSHAAYLLAKWREPRAYPLLLRWFALPGEQAHILGGDVISEDGDRLLASVFDGNVEPMRTLIVNVEADEHCRGAAVGALGLLGLWGELPLAQVEALLLGLVREGVERQPSWVWDELLIQAAQTGAIEVLEAIRPACEAGLASCADDFEEMLDLARKTPRVDLLRENRLARPVIDDVAEETSWWACWEREGKTDLPFELNPFLTPHDSPPHRPPTPRPPPEPVVREAPKVGRNDPCPCGSGKKYKKCCGS